MKIIAFVLSSIGFLILIKTIGLLASVGIVIVLTGLILQIADADIG